MKRTCWIASLLLCGGSVPADAGLFDGFVRHRRGCHEDCAPSCAAPAVCCEEPTCCAPSDCLTYGCGSAEPTCCAPSAPGCCVPSAPSCCSPALPGCYAPVGSYRSDPAPVISPYQGGSAPIIYGPQGGSAPVPYSITPLTPAAPTPHPQAAPADAAPVPPKAAPAPSQADPPRAAPVPAEEPFEEEVMDKPARDSDPAGDAEAYFPTRALPAPGRAAARPVGPRGLAN